MKKFFLIIANDPTADGKKLFQFDNFIIIANIIKKKRKDFIFLCIQFFVVSLVFFSIFIFISIFLFFRFFDLPKKKIF